MDKLENLESRATRDFLADDYDPSRCPLARVHVPRRKCHRIVGQARRVRPAQRQNPAVPERKPFALVDAVACVLADGGRYGSQETARLALETVVESAVALAAVRALIGGGDST
jgi:hypothetical protein